MILQIVLASALACAPPPIDRKQAEALVLASPNIRAAVSERGARPFFEWVHRAPTGWHFDVNARHGCSTPRPCSGLLGHYAVNATTGEVEDLDADGGDGAVVSSPHIRRLQASFLRGRCGLR